ncbi:MAG: prepilin-type N-terminal cleavage/methylation domain-containing protein [Candidatus Omnitrophica bacterium]|nr:prepilin-type N-terminal cleavage/methylation domain-containing protein [Candidatus Omnitrophota bacterium]
MKIINSKNRKGFTLFELILVALLIAILVTLMAPNFADMGEKARTSEAINTIGSIKTAEELVYLEKGEFLTDTVGNGSILPIEFPAHPYSQSNPKTYWVYNASVDPGTKTTKVVITATRTIKEPCSGSSGSYGGLTIILTWDENATPPESWSGTHLFAPEN